MELLPGRLRKRGDRHLRLGGRKRTRSCTLFQRPILLRLARRNRVEFLHRFVTGHHAIELVKLRLVKLGLMVQRARATGRLLLQLRICRRARNDNKPVRTRLIRGSWGFFDPQQHHPGPGGLRRRGLSGLRNSEGNQLQRRRPRIDIVNDYAHHACERNLAIGISATVFFLHPTSGDDFTVKQSAQCNICESCGPIRRSFLYGIFRTLGATGKFPSNQALPNRRFHGPRLEQSEQHPIRPYSAILPAEQCGSCSQLPAHEQPAGTASTVNSRSPRHATGRHSGVGDWGHNLPIC